MGMGSQMGNLMMISMFSGGNNMFSNMFEGMFDEDAGASFDMNDDDDDAEEEVPVRKPAKAKKTTKKAKED